MYSIWRPYSVLLRNAQKDRKHLESIARCYKRPYLVYLVETFVTTSVFRISTPANAWKIRNITFSSTKNKTFPFQTFEITRVSQRGIFSRLRTIVLEWKNTNKHLDEATNLSIELCSAIASSLRNESRAVLSLYRVSRTASDLYSLRIHSSCSCAYTNTEPWNSTVLCSRK